MTTYKLTYISDSDNNSLEHYGILGMKWGVRRFQNKDGSYTKKGLERYNQSHQKYLKAKRDLEDAKKVKKKMESLMTHNIEQLKPRLRKVKRILKEVIKN